MVFYNDLHRRIAPKWHFLEEALGAHFFQGVQQAQRRSRFSRDTKTPWGAETK
jgi:hypothetical protein